ncbi:MAG TPA: hypothetical protein EYH09_02320, partial [Candidatus Nanopusillus sp.]|nr:hypothetical protein [Candidatus Nanopusillus sp.]
MYTILFIKNIRKVEDKKMLPVVPYKLDEIKVDLKRYAIENLGLLDAEFEGSNISQLINLLSYSNVINNTNLMFGLNEMFITQATDRKNVIKHARQMGYNYKRNVSFQYKIRLKSLKEGLVVLPKYQKFSSGGNDYIYMGKDITNTYGTELKLKSLSTSDRKLKPNDYIISDSEIIAKVVESVDSTNTIIIETIGEERISKYSKEPNDIMIYDGSVDGKRTFKTIGKISTFIVDGNVLKMQLDDIEDFPIYSNDLFIGKVKENKIKTEYDIKYIEHITFMEDSSTKYVDIDDLTIDANVIEFPSSEVLLNMSIPKNSGKIIEKGTVFDLPKGIDDLDRMTIYIDEVEAKDYIIEERKMLIKPINEVKSQDFDIVNGIVQKNIKSDDLDHLFLKHKLTEDIIEVPYSIDDGVISLSDNSYDNSYVAEIQYNELLDISRKEIKLSYYETVNFDNITLEVSYIHDKNNDGLLDKTFFFSDLTGEYPQNETIKRENNPYGWNGFSAFDYDVENNVLSFDISSDINNYVQMLDSTNHLKYLEAEKLHEVLKPFKKTVVHLANRIESSNGISYEKTNISFSVQEVNVKDELELIVKEGTLKRYSDMDDEGNILYPDLSFIVTKEMAKAEFFTIFSPNVEDNGIELFISTNEDEEKASWVQRKNLLTERSEMINTKKPLVSDYNNFKEFNEALREWKTKNKRNTFLVLSDLNYEDYINIYLKFAGSGVTLEEGFNISMNILESKGEEGFTDDIIEPLNSDFEAIPYLDRIPTILYTQGTNIESTESIRKNAPLYSNTANRAVTANDYVTICNSQPYIASSEVWGGEDIPNIDAFTIKEKDENYSSEATSEFLKYIKENFGDEATYKFSSFIKENYSGYASSIEIQRYIKERFGQIYISVVPQSKPNIFEYSK